MKGSLNIGSDEKVILFAGRITVKKGITSLIRVLDLLTNEGMKVKLILAGEIIDRQYFKIFTKSNVLHIPPREKINDLFEVCDCVVLPSFQEAFPYLMLEAGAWKKPFIGTNIPGISEFIQEGENGLLFEPNNIKMLAKCLRELFTNTQLKEKLTASNFKRVEGLPDCKEYANYIKEHYFKLINK